MSYEPKTNNSLLAEIKRLEDKEDWRGVLTNLSDDKLVSLKDTNGYFHKAYALTQLGDHTESINYCLKQIELDPESAKAYELLGENYFAIENYDLALQYFNTAFEKNPSRIVVLIKISEVYTKLENFDSAIRFIQQYIDSMADTQIGYFYLGEAYLQKNKLLEAKIAFQKHIKSDTEPDILTTISLSKIEEIDRRIKSKEYDNISKSITTIKRILLFKDKCVTHYTSLSVSRLLILGGSELRLSEGTFLNDPTEGTEIFKIFEPFGIFRTNQRGGRTYFETIYKPFVQKPFIGSFVAKVKENDLTLWRMYGKDNKEEAKGCAITIRREDLLNLMSSNLIENESKSALNVNDMPDSDSGISITNLKEDFDFYRVAYKNVKVTLS